MSNMLYQTFYDIPRLVLWGDNPDGDGKRARFILSFRDGQPRFSVYTGGTGKDAVINFPMDMVTATAAMNYLLDIANGGNATQVNLESLTPVYENDRKTDQKRVLSTLRMGKSKDGVVYVSVLSEGRAKIVFPFKPSPYHKFLDANKEAIPDATVSRFLAVGMANMVLSALAHIMVNYTNEEYEEGSRKPALIKQANSGGGASRGSSQPQFSDLDDIL